MTRARFAFGAGAAWLASAMFVALPARALDARAEAAARDAVKKAGDDFDTQDFPTAVARLAAAAKGCGASRCSSMTKAVVLRDLGTMQFRSGDKPAAAGSFAQALKIEPDLDLRSRYVAPDLRAAWDRARPGAAETTPADAPVAAPKARPLAPPAAPPPPERSEEPEGDFTHTPAVEQRPRTPLPVYAEYPGKPPPARVVVRYKGAAMSDWGRVDLARESAGWGGLIPCTDVAAGTMRYWIQGFDRDGVPSASSGDPKHPYAVPIRDALSGEPPHLPDKRAPQTCGDHASDDAGPAAGEDAPEPSPPAADAGSAYARLWVGASVALDIVDMPSGDDVCKLNPAGVPANAANIYCTNPDGTDFPSRASPKQNTALVQGDAGHSGGGLLAGNVRVMLTVDYAVLPNLLAGGRIGYVANAYPGSVAAKDGRAAGFRIHGEARATYVFGSDPLSKVGFAPVAFAGLGVAEFDGHIASSVSLAGIPGRQFVDVWRTGGPFFLLLGGGARYQLSPRVTCTGALRLNLAVGNGLLPTFGPELGVAYGF